MNLTAHAALAATVALTLSACRSSAERAVQPDLARDIRASLELPVSEPPFTDVHAQWKERLEQPYVFIELRGSYTQTAQNLKGVFDALAKAGVTPSGPPFALFYDDPGHTSTAELRSRACVPVDGSVSLPAPYAADVLPSSTVVYAFVGGPYGDVPRAYPGVLAFMKKMGWAESGPIRESYLVSPNSTSNWADLVTEVQVPASPAR